MPFLTKNKYMYYTSSYEKKIIWWKIFLPDLEKFKFLSGIFS